MADVAIHPQQICFWNMPSNGIARLLVERVEDALAQFCGLSASRVKSLSRRGLSMGRWPANFPRFREIRQSVAQDLQNRLAVGGGEVGEFL